MRKEGQTRYFIPSAEIKDYKVMINEKSFCDQPVENNVRKYNNILKLTIGQGDD